MSLTFREYGAGPGPVIVLHGGPAAAGDLAPFAKELAKRWEVIEPYQRGSRATPLAVATHIADLNALIRQRCHGKPPVIVGHSWGAMLALAYAAEHPEKPLALVLIGCGTFSEAAREKFVSRREALTTPEHRAEIDEIERTEDDPGRRLAAVGWVVNRIYGYDIEEPEDFPEWIDATAHRETWDDMIRLQREGVYPAAFRAVSVPVLMIHGEDDPHPGRATYEDLRACIPQLEYRELGECGHSPWLERWARRPFFNILHAWIEERISASAG